MIKLNAVAVSPDMMAAMKAQGLDMLVEYFKLGATVPEAVRSFARERSGNGVVSIEVRDEGPGLPPAGERARSEREGRALGKPAVRAAKRGLPSCAPHRMKCPR